MLDENEEGFSETTFGGWFNADLYFYLNTFPRVEATYNIFAILGEEKSNVVTVRVQKP
jgi:hypothetical protein